MVKGHDDVEEEDAQNSSWSKWACSSISSSSGGAKPSYIKKINIFRMITVFKHCIQHCTVYN